MGRRGFTLTLLCYAGKTEILDVQHHQGETGQPSLGDGQECVVLLMSQVRDAALPVTHPAALALRPSKCCRATRGPAACSSAGQAVPPREEPATLGVLFRLARRVCRAPGPGAGFTAAMGSRDASATTEGARGERGRGSRGCPCPSPMLILGVALHGINKPAAVI